MWFDTWKVRASQVVKIFCVELKTHSYDLVWKLEKISVYVLLPWDVNLTIFMGFGREPAMGIHRLIHARTFMDLGL